MRVGTGQHCFPALPVLTTRLGSPGPSTEGRKRPSSDESHQVPSRSPGDRFPGGHRPAAPLITARRTCLPADAASGTGRLLRAAARAAAGALRTASPSETGEGADPYPAQAAASCRPASGKMGPAPRPPWPDHLRPRAARTLTCVIDPQWWQLGLAGLAVLAGAMAVRTTGMGDRKSVV